MKRLLLFVIMLLVMSFSYKGLFAIDIDIDKITKVDGKYIQSEEIDVKELQAELNEIEERIEGLQASLVRRVARINAQIASLEEDKIKIQDLLK